MARKFLTPIDLSKLELQNALVHVLSSAPSSPAEGQIYYDSTNKTLEYYNGTAWISLGRLDLLEAPTADVSLNSHKLTNVTDPTSAQDAATRAYVLARGLQDFDGANTTGDVDLNSHKLTNVTDPTSAQDAATRAYVLARSLTDFDGAAVAGSVDMNTQKIINLAAPTGANDAARKADVDAVAAGLNWKDSVRAATTAAGTLASSFENGDTIDGVALATGDRILIKDQSAGAENGIYVVAASGAPTRATDADTAAEILQMAVFVEEGTTNADTGWVQTTNAPITLNTTALAYSQFTGVGGITAGTGLTKTGNTLDAVGGTGIVANANDIAIDPAVVVQKHVADIGDGSTTSIVVTHNAGTKDNMTIVYDKTTPFAEVYPEIRKTSTTTSTLVFAVAPTTNQYRAVTHW